MACDLCGAPMGKEYTVKEMMFGWDERFVYGECGGCRSLQLLTVPDDLGCYYPSDYYSFTASPDPLWRKVAKRLWAEAAVRGLDSMARVIGRGRMPPWVEYLRLTDLDRAASICDVGSGGGAVLLSMKAQGFRNLCGLDAFIPEATVIDGIPIMRGSPLEMIEKYDLVMLNHSFEHMPKPIEMIQAVASHLTDRGAVMIRIPVADSPLWERYGADWSSIDAPRHLYLPSQTGMEVAAQRAGCHVFAVVPETSPVQFLRSEQYRQGIPLRDPRAHEINPAASGFTSAQLAGFGRDAEECNRSRRFGAAAFFLRPA